MELVDRYLLAIKRLLPGLPGRQQEDILKELSANILSEMDDREAELGRPLTEAEQLAILEQQGSPTVVAGRYRQEQGTLTFGRVIIGPIVFPLYIRILALNLCITLVVASVVRILLQGRVPLSTLLFPAVIQFIAVTGVFACIDYAQRRYRVLDRWNTREPRPARDPLKISRASTLFEMFFSVLFVITLLRVPGAAYIVAYMFVGPVASYFEPSAIGPMLFAPNWQAFYLPILFMTVLGIAQQGLNFAFPRWTRNRLLVRAALSTLGLILNAFLFRAGDVLVPNPDLPSAAQYIPFFHLINVCVHWSLLLGIILSAFTVGGQIYRAWRVAPAASPSSSATVAC